MFFHVSFLFFGKLQGPCATLEHPWGASWGLWPAWSVPDHAFWGVLAAWDAPLTPPAYHGVLLEVSSFPGTPLERRCARQLWYFLGHLGRPCGIPGNPLTGPRMRSGLGCVRKKVFFLACACARALSEHSHTEQHSQRSKHSQRRVF